METPEQKPYVISPFFLTVASLVIFGSGYLYLKLYRRFFIAIGIMILTLALSSASFIWQLRDPELISGNVPLAMNAIGSLVSSVVFFGMLIDTYLQARRMSKANAPRPEKNERLLIFGIILIIAYSAISFLNNYAPSSVADYVYCAAANPADAQQRQACKAELSSISEYLESEY